MDTRYTLFYLTHNRHGKPIVASAEFWSLQEVAQWRRRYPKLVIVCKEVDLVWTWRDMFENWFTPAQLARFTRKHGSRNYNRLSA